MLNVSCQKRTENYKILMNDFEWESNKTLTDDKVSRFAAGFGVLFSISAILFVTGINLWGYIFLLVAILVGVLVAINSPPTKVSVKGYEVFYGNSTKANIENLKEVKLVKQFFIEEVIVLEGNSLNERGVIPTKGIPKTIINELIMVLEERITANKGH